MTRQLPPIVGVIAIRAGTNRFCQSSDSDFAAVLVKKKKKNQIKFVCLWDFSYILEMWQSGKHLEKDTPSHLHTDIFQIVQR